MPGNEALPVVSGNFTPVFHLLWTGCRLISFVERFDLEQLGTDEVGCGGAARTYLLPQHRFIRQSRGPALHVLCPGNSQPPDRSLSPSAGSTLAIMRIRLVEVSSTIPTKRCKFYANPGYGSLSRPGKSHDFFLLLVAP